MVVGTLSLVQKGQSSGCSGCSDTVDAMDTVCSGHSGCSGIVVYGGVCAVYCIQCIHWFGLFAPKTMSPPPYTTILLHPLRTASPVFSGLNFLYQRQCPHHHITLFHCVLCPLHTASTVCCVHCVTASAESTGLTFLHQRQCPHHHVPLFHCILHPLCHLV